MRNKEYAITKDWGVKTIDQVCDNLDNLRVPISKDKRIKGSIPYYGATGVLDYVSGYIFDEELLLIGEDGADWSKFAESAYLIKGKSWVNNHAHVLKCKGIDPVYLKEYLNYNDLNLYISGGTRGKLTKGILSKIPVPTPSSIEQKKIAEILACVDEDIEKTDEIIKKTQKLKKGLMRELLSRGIGHTEFKKTELGKIPQGWTIEPLSKFIASLDAGVSVNSEDREKTEDEIGILKTSAVFNGVFNEKQHKTVLEKEKNRVAVPLKEDRIILSRMNTSDLVGANAYIPRKFDDIFLPDRLWQLEPFNDREISMKWLSYVMYNLWKNKCFANMATGTSASMKNISKLDILAMKLPFPDVDEQKRIAEILSAVDDKIDIYKQIKSKLTELKKGLMQDLLSGEVRTNYEHSK